MDVTQAPAAGRQTAGGHAQLLAAFAQLLKDLPQQARQAGLTLRKRAGRKQYKEATRLLLHALTCPTTVVNAITMAAYKKFLLLSLLTEGKLSYPLGCLSKPSHHLVSQAAAAAAAAAAHLTAVGSSLPGVHAEAALST